MTNWLEIDPATVPLSDFIYIDGSNGIPGAHRMPTVPRENKQEESNSTIGRLPRIILVAHTDIYNPGGISGKKYAILSGANAWKTSIDFGRDPRSDNFRVYVAPDHITDPVELARIRVKLNRAQVPASLLDAISDYAAAGVSEYQIMLQLLQTYPLVSPTEVAICLNPHGGLTAKKQGIENGNFVIVSNLARAEEAIKILQHCHLDIGDQRRVDFLKKNYLFAQMLTVRVLASTFRMDYSGYPCVLPPEQDGRLYLGDPAGQHPVLTTRNTILFNKIRKDVIANDKNFPLIPYTGRKSVKQAWIDDILDSMAIPRP